MKYGLAFLAGAYAGALALSHYLTYHLMRQLLDDINRNG